MEYKLIVNQEKESIDADISGRNIKCRTGRKIYDASFINISEQQILLNVNGQNFNAFVYSEAGTKTIVINGRTHFVQDADLIEQHSAGKKSPANFATTVASPMPAVVISVLARIGERVEKGQGLVVVSAMKMETTLFAPYDGKVTRINVKEGDKVMPSDILVDIEKEGEDI